MSLAVLADHLASKGRNGDTMLVHMTPGEVQGLHALALAHGGKLTVNPDTGLLEASFLKRLLPMIAGMALNFVAPGIGTAIGTALGGLSGAVGTGILVGGVTGLATGSLKQGIMAGLGAYGGASLAGGLMGASGAQGTAGALGVEGAATGAGSQAAMLAEQTAGFGAEGLQKLAESAAYAKGAAPSLTPALTAGVSNLGTEAGRKAFMEGVGGTSGLYKAAAASAAPGMLEEPVKTTTPRPGFSYTPRIRPMAFDQYTQSLEQLPMINLNEEKKDEGGMAGGGIVALANGGFTDERVAQALRESMGQGFSLQDSLGGAASKFGISQEQLARAQALLNAPPAPTPAPAAAPAPLTPAEYAAKSFITAEERGPLGTLSQEAQTQLALEEAKRGISANLNAQQIANLVNAKYQKDFTEQNVLDFMKAQGLLGVKATPDLFPGVTGTAPGTAVTGTPAIDYAAAPTMEQVRSDYVKGGGRTDMPTITDIQPTDRTYTQNQAFALLQGYLKTNPNAQYQDVVGFARSKGIPEMQARAAYNEFRFSGLSGGSQQAYDYLMGRGAYPVKPFLPSGTPVMRPYAEVVGLAPPQFYSGRRVNFDQAGNPQKLDDTSSSSKAKTDGIDGKGNVEWENTATGARTVDTPDRYKNDPEWRIVRKSAGGGLMDVATAAAAHGGQIDRYNLGGYSDGGRLLRGPGDGVSDSIPATIGNKQPARLADGEFVIPARIVSEIGNGSTEAGARKLYKMMERVQRARAKTVGKGRSKVAKDTGAEQYLPA